ncbi:MAG: TIGR00268 family protein, partial [Synergistaceae bacterium]|nr:TIGR00268 family protein [Synergistaceae bacterium]
MQEVPCDALEEKFETLKARLGDLKRVAVLFSGGLDSTLLAFVAFRVLGEDAAALTVDSPLMSPEELEDAREEAGRIGIPFHILGEPLRDDVRMNPPDRCYHCRKARHEKAREWARRNGFPFLLDGGNTTDLEDYRPG